MAKKPGRPPKKAGTTKTRYLQVRVSEAEKATFDVAADLAGLEMSAWVRERLRIAARKELIEVGRQVPFLKSE